MRTGGASLAELSPDELLAEDEEEVPLTGIRGSSTGDFRRVKLRDWQTAAVRPLDDKMK